MNGGKDTSLPTSASPRCRLDINGGDGNDRITGTDGNDTLNGGTGNDRSPATAATTP